jgi:hypothetical protein
MAFEDYFSQVEQDGIIYIYDIQNNRRALRILSLGALLVAGVMYVDGKGIEIAAALILGSILFFVFSFIISKHTLVLTVNKHTNTLRKSKQDIPLSVFFCQRIETDRISNDETIEHKLYLVKNDTKTIHVYTDGKNKLIALSKRIGQHTNLPLDE